MLGGIFVGGASSRMGSPKGLMRAGGLADGGEVLVLRLARIVREAGLEPVLVGQRPEYETMGLRSIADDADAGLSAGPLGGLIALLEEAHAERVVAIACDMPHVTVNLVRKLVHAHDAAVVAPKRDGRWEPLFARYDSARVLPIARARAARHELALQGLLEDAGASALELDSEEVALLDDWDTPADAAATRERTVMVFANGTTTTRVDRVAVEEPLEIRAMRELVEMGAPPPSPVESLRHAPRFSITTTMRTPGADVDLAAGFLLGEHVVHAREDILAIAPEGPNAVAVDLTPATHARLAKVDRRFGITSSCGICGRTSIDAIVRGTPQAHDDIRISADTVTRMPDALRRAQSVFDRTGALHAAGLFVVDGAQGRIVRSAEDVGRHNAVDKVLGAELMSGHLPLTGHTLVLSGRIAFELVQKAALAGVTAIVAIGAPTSLAIELAEASNITLIGFARDGRFNVYAGAYRLTR